MTILRRRHNSNFTIVPNAIFEHPELSIEAKGVLGYLLSRPADWTIRLTHIGPALKIGRNKTERIFLELRETGYVIRGDQARQGGKWGATQFEVWDEPNPAKGQPLEASADTLSEEHDTAAAPCPGKPLTAKPHAVFRGTYKGLKENKTESTKDVADDAGAREPSKSLITPEAFTLSTDLMHLQRLEEDDPRCIAAAYGVQAWLTKGWDANVIRATVEIVMSRRTDAPKGLRYFESAIAEAHAERDRPLPVVPHNAGIGAIHNRGSKHATHRNGGGGFALNALEFARRAAGEPDCTDHS
jgi:hypothetical protein